VISTCWLQFIRNFLLDILIPILILILILILISIVVIVVAILLLRTVEVYMRSCRSNVVYVC